MLTIQGVHMPQSWTLMSIYLDVENEGGCPHHYHNRVEWIKHPSMWEQQAQQSIPDIPLPSKTLETPRGNSKAFPSQMIIPPVNTGFPTIRHAS